MLFFLYLPISLLVLDKPLERKKNFCNYHELELNLPSRAEDLLYLGLQGVKSKSFKLSEVNAKVIVLEIVTAYCPYCAGSIPQINRFYELIKDSSYASQIKIMGIGMANSEEEIDAFRNKYELPFPVLADEDNRVYKILGRIKLPYWVILFRNSKGTWEELYTQSEKLPEPENLLDLIVQRINRE
ncbi:MAG: peroxiredoxin family protein [Candidatus Omnitrophota bacterium]